MQPFAHPAPGQVGRPNALARWLRVPAFTIPNVTLAVVAHVAAAGHPPDAAAVTALLACVALLTLAVAGRRHSLTSLLVAVAVVQVGVHIALLEHHPATAPHPLVLGPAMLCAHALASAVLAWWLARGEAALWRTVVRAIARLLGAIPVLPHTRATAAPQHSPRATLPWRSLRAGVGLRAPPEAA